MLARRRLDAGFATDGSCADFNVFHKDGSEVRFPFDSWIS